MTNCGDLAFTGLPVIGLLVLAIMALVAGLLLIITDRRPPARRAVLAITLLAVIVLATGSAAPGPARADPPECGTPGVADGLLVEAPIPSAPGGPADQRPDPPESPVTIGQISSPLGIAPGHGPAAIVGRIVNDGPEAIFVAAVTVRISFVDKAADAVPGPCDATDYELTNPVMPVGRTLQPGESAVFSGAFLGFRDKPLNQDACQAAIVGLAYVSS